MFHRQNNVARMITLDGTGSECSYANPTSHRCNQDLGGAQEVALSARCDQISSSYPVTVVHHRVIYLVVEEFIILLLC